MDFSSEVPSAQYYEEPPERPGITGFNGVEPAMTEITAGATSALDHHPEAFEVAEALPVTDAPAEAHEAAAYPADMGRVAYVDRDDNTIVILEKDDVDYIADRLTQLRAEVSYDTEVEANGADRAALDEVKRMVTAYGVRLGIDLSARIPSDKDVHIFPNFNAHEAATGQRVGNHGYDTGISIARQPLAQKTPTGDQAGVPPHILAHEYMHELSALGVTQLPDGRLHVDSVWGLMVPGATGSKEWIDDVASIRAQEAVGSQNALPSYPVPLHILGRAVLEKIAAHSGKDGQEVEDMIIRGYFDARQTAAAIGLFYEALGDDAAEAFLRMPRDMSIQHARTLADRIGLPDVYAMLDETEWGEPHDFSWPAAG